MARLVRLRPWQKAALDAFWASTPPDFLAVATPGAGKTTLALTVARQVLAAQVLAAQPGRLIVVAPTQHLKIQWARAAAAFDLHLEPEWSAADGRLPADMHGVVTTYQQVATSAAALRRLASGAFVVFDELHHAGDDRAWGEGIRHAFELSPRRLALSGTPFRSDTRAIPFIRYVGDEAKPDYEYGYGEALADGAVVRPVYFPRIDGHMEWVAPDGSLWAAGFADPLSRAQAGQRLRTALSVEGEWLPAVLRQAHDQLLAVRAVRPDAGGLVIAIDQDHARGIAELLRRRLGVRATVVTSDDPTASDRIGAFAAGDDPWIVAVRMVSEGVDIPRLHVGVYATTTTTELFFRQAVGRIVRWTSGGRRQKAYLFIPDDPRLRTLAWSIAELRRHSLARRSSPEDSDAPEPVVGAEQFRSEQLSLFSAISAVAVGDGHRTERLDGFGAASGARPVGADAGRGIRHHGLHGGGDGGIEVDLPPPPPISGGALLGGPGGVGAGAGVTLREHKKGLRDDNAERARRLARLTGLTHAQVNAELNRLAGIDRITEATAEQLERRLARADAWLEKVLPQPPRFVRPSGTGA